MSWSSPDSLGSWVSHRLYEPSLTRLTLKGVPGIQAVTRGRGGGGSWGLKKKFPGGHISCILVYPKTDLSHLE